MSDRTCASDNVLKDMPTTLRVARPEHPHEIEAERVVRDDEGSAKRRLVLSQIGPRSGQGEPSSRVGGGGTEPVDPEVARSIAALREEVGLPLDRRVRERIEQRFGRSLGHVRVHTSTAGEAAARAMGASAFTLGRDIFLPRANERGRERLLVHEVSHTLQRGEPHTIFRSPARSMNEPTAAPDMEKRACSEDEQRALQRSLVRSRELVLRARRRLFTLRGGRARKAMFGDRSLANLVTMHAQLTQLADSLRDAAMGEGTASPSRPRLLCSDVTSAAAYNQEHNIVFRSPLPNAERALDEIVIHEFAHSLLGLVAVDIYTQDQLFYRLRELPAFARGESIHQRNAESYATFVLFLASDEADLEKYLDQTRQEAGVQFADVRWQEGPGVPEEDERKRGESSVLNALAIVQYALRSIERSSTHLMHALGNLTPEREMQLYHTHPFAAHIPWGKGRPSADEVGLVERLIAKAKVLAAIMQKLVFVEMIGAPNTSEEPRQSRQIGWIGDRESQSGEEVRFDLPRRTLLVTRQFFTKARASQIRWIVTALVERALGPVPLNISLGESPTTAQSESLRAWGAVQSMVAGWGNTLSGG